MKSRRDFLKSAAAAGAGVTFSTCELVSGAAYAQSSARDPDTLKSDIPLPVVVNGKRMLTIDIHCHTEVSGVWPLIEGREELGGRNPFAPNPLTRTTDLALRLEDMDAMGIDIQALSLNVGQYFYWAEPDLADKIVTLQNEKLAEISAAHPDRFVAIGAVALQHPELAAAQLEHAVKKLGHRGVMITGSVEGQEISAEKFNPFWAKAEELDVVVFIHPRFFPSGAGRFAGRGNLFNIIGNPLETTVALSHMIFSGFLDNFSGLKIVAAHGGGFLPSYIGRSDHCHVSPYPGCKGAGKKKPSDYLKQLYFDTLVYRTENLDHLIAEVGVGQLVLGTDHPYAMMNKNPIAHLLSVPGLSDDDIEAIFGGTLKRLLKIET